MFFAATAVTVSENVITRSAVGETPVALSAGESDETVGAVLSGAVVSIVTLDASAAAKVSVALTRVEQGNLSNAKSVGEGVLEYRIDWGPGYRVYFGWDGDVLVILLTGGTKKIGRAHV